jgi:hypothetical protein
MASTTTVELQSFTHNGSSRSVLVDEPPPDAVIAQSQLADATVPDGGYGWVIVTCCAIITWWFVGTTYCWGVIKELWHNRAWQAHPLSRLLVVWPSH